MDQSADQPVIPPKPLTETADLLAVGGTPAGSPLPATQPGITATASAPALVAEELIDIEYFSKIKLRVARIESVEPVPKSKKLLKLQVDLGERLGKRQILAGISQFYTPEQLVGKKIVIVANLKPAKLMGVESQGMLLAASSEDGTLLTVLDPGPLMPEGAGVI